VEDELVEWFRENDSLWNTQRTAYRYKSRRQHLLAIKAEELGINGDHLRLNENNCTAKYNSTETCKLKKCV